MPIIVLLCHLKCYYKLHKKLKYAYACNILFKDVSQASVEWTVHHRVPILITEWTVKKHAAVAETCAIFPPDVKMWLQVIQFSITLNRIQKMTALPRYFPGESVSMNWTSLYVFSSLCQFYELRKLTIKA